jgi:sugar lactone lactonase YvrE
MKTIILSLILASTAYAVKTERWELNSAQDFLHGKLNRLAVSSEGELHLGYGNTKLGEFAKEVWCSTVARDGTIYFGTGSPADVYAVGKDGQAGKLFQTEAIAVTALATDSRGNVYAATMAEGKIFKIPAGKKEGAEYCRLHAPYIWALVFDKDDRLYAGTGPDGKIYRINPDGKAEEYFAAEDSNILSLALDADGALLAGGSDRGLLYRIAEKGKGVVLHEFSEDEIKSLIVSGGDLYIGVNKQKVKRPRTAAGRRPSAAEFEDLTQRLTSQYGMRVTPETAPRETPPEARLGNLLSGTLYKRNADGRVDRLALWDNEAIMNMALDATGDIIVASAGQGRVYRVHGGEKWDLLFDLDEQQALTVATRDGKLAFVGTGNIGNAYLVDPQPASDGDYTTEVHDCKFLTTWGNVSWMGTGSIAVTTRTGNTALPDKTWSDWSAPLKSSPSKVTSSRARFIQVRTRLERASDPVLQSLSLYSQVQNQKPEIHSLEIGEKPKPPAEKPKADSDEEKKPEEPKPKAASPIKKLSWHADARDGDTLVYRLFYRAEGDDAWVPVPLEKPLKKTEYWWDTESVADGWYRLKLVASDEESNAAGDALADEKISEPVKVDNRRPDVVNLAFNNNTLTGIARDNLSLIRNLEYSVDGGDWKFFAPKDGVFDDREETFEVKLDPLKPGPHTIAVRATDEEGNIGVEKLSVRVK